MSKAEGQFIRVNDVIAIHIERYNRQIDRLLTIEDYPKSDLVGNRVSRKEYYRSRERKIRAFTDAINTIVAKEKLLQYHNSGFHLELFEEKIVIEQKSDLSDRVSRLSFDENLELLQMVKKARKDRVELASITESKQIEQEKKGEVKLITEGLNIDFIKKVEPNEAIAISDQTSLTPVLKLRQALMKISANQYKSIGAKLDNEEKKLITESN